METTIMGYMGILGYRFNGRGFGQACDGATYIARNTMIAIHPLPQK